MRRYWAVLVESCCWCFCKGPRPGAEYGPLRFRPAAGGFAWVRFTLLSRFRGRSTAG